MITIIDTFPAYLDFWNMFSSESIDDQIEGWRKAYMADWPELYLKQIEDYESDGEDWREIARNRVFPDLEQRLGPMRTAYDNLQEIVPTTLSKSSQVLDFYSDIVVVIYVGIGLGAGWATTFDGKPAILLGLENIAECGWIEKNALVGLIAHEFGHVVHFERRDGAGMPKGEGPWWQLYIEGFAMRSEHLVSGFESWHMRERAGDNNWLEWCKDNRVWLAAEFIRSVDAGESVRPFFGSWYDLKGYSQTGYYLGHELIRLMEVDLSLKEIALLDQDDPRLMKGMAELTNRELN